VNYLDQFLIPISGIKPGRHTFGFKIDDLFFDQFEYSEIKSGSIRVDVELEKEEKLMHFHFSLDGVVRVPCDRCYEMMDQMIGGEEDLIVKFGSDFHEESEDVQVIPEGESQFSISQFCYEYIHLLVPARRVHPDDENGNSTCDPEVIKKLEEFTKPDEPDPRWDALKKLKTKK
jgi:uncharacterized protein